MPQRINFSPKLTIRDIDETISYIKNKEAIFIDGCIFDADSFLRKTNEYSFFGEYNPAELTKIVSWTTKLCELSALEQAKTTKHICDEIKGLEDKLVYRLTHTQTSSYNKHKYPKNKFERYKKNNEKNALRNKELYKQLQKNVYDFYSSLLTKSPRLCKEEEHLTSTLHKITHIRRLKDKHPSFQGSVYQQEQYKKCKDEELVARAYHEVISGTKDVIILTKDKDIERLTIAMYELFETKYFGFVPIIRDHVLKNPIEIINTQKLRITKKYDPVIKDKIGLYQPDFSQIKELNKQLYDDKQIIKTYLESYS